MTAITRNWAEPVPSKVVATTHRALGRPRQFDENEILDRAVDVFWCRGANGATTRFLESDLGLTQSSIYNAFGSKNELMLRAIDRYNERLDRDVVAPLDTDAAGEAELLDFVDDVLEWITEPAHPGCLLLNTLGQLGSVDDALVERARGYRQRVRSVLARALDQAGVDNADSRAELVLGGLMGLNISAYGGADRVELDTLADALRSQICDWSAS